MGTTSFSATIARQGKLLTAIFWLLSTIIYFTIHGVVTSLEAAKYIEEARRYIDTGSFSAPRFYFYCVTIFIMVFAIKIKAGMLGAFLIQALLNFLAYLLFYKAMTKVFHSPFTPLVIIIYLLAFSPYQSWVVFLYTESVFFSAILILISVLVLYPPANWKNILLLVLSLLFTIVSRPLGILFGMGVFLYFFYYAGKKWKLILTGSSVIFLVLGYYSVNTVFESIKDWSITQGFEQESIICDMPAPQPYHKLELATEGSPVFHLWYYVSHNFSHFIHFAGVKLQYFFLMTRNYYSRGHNVFLLLNSIILYSLAIAGFFINKRYFSKGLMIFIMSSLLMYTLTIIFQCDDYQNRFILSVFPLFVILAARTTEHLLLNAFKNHK